MLLTVKKFIGRVPFLGPLFSFDLACHRKAGVKAFVIWLISTSPIIIASALSPAPRGDASLWQKYVEKISSSFLISEQYVYVAAFISPFLFIIIERIIDVLDANRSASFGEKIVKTYRIGFEGFVLHWLIGCLVFILAIITYVSTKVSIDFFESTFLYLFVRDKAVWVYLVAVYFWYLAVLDGVAFGANYVSDTRDDEEEFREEFSDRIGHRGGA